MACRTLELGDGARVIVCGRFPKPKSCVACGSVAGYLCDHPASGGKTCDAPICDDHAHTQGRNRHFCPIHQEQSGQLALL